MQGKGSRQLYSVKDLSIIQLSKGFECCCVNIVLNKKLKYIFFVYKDVILELQLSCVIWIGIGMYIFFYLVFSASINMYL